MVYIAIVQLWVCLWCNGNLVCLECRSLRFESSPVNLHMVLRKPPICGIGPNLRVTERGPGERGCAPPTFFEHFQRIPFPRDVHCPQVTHRKEAKCIGVYIKHGKIHFHINVTCPGGSENGKWIKLFLSSEEVASLTMDLLMLRIQERFP